MSKPLTGQGPQSKNLKPYRKEADYSYALGAFPTFELLTAKPEAAVRVIVHSSFTDSDKLAQLCEAHRVPFELNDRLLARISGKENCYAAGVFSKYYSSLRADRPHIVLVCPSNMGNLGTIVRTAVGLGICDLAVILPGADIFNPKTVRASMGALFSLCFEFFSSFSEYAKRFPRHKIFTLMTNGATALNEVKDTAIKRCYSLVFGNEAAGLDDSFGAVGDSVYIPQTAAVDSLNLPVAVGIAIYVFQTLCTGE